MSMQRIAIIGVSGAGKSTIARQIGQILDLPVIHLDRLYWGPGWAEPPREEWEELQRERVQREHWILDGNYSSTLEIRFARADTVIYLDFPRHVALWRATMRSIRWRGRTRPDLAEGCVEKFIERDFASWMWNYPRRSRPRTLAMLARAEAQGLRGIRLRSSRDVRAFLDRSNTTAMQ